MADALEAALTRALDRAAEAAPEPAPSLAESLLRQHSHRVENRSTNRGRLLVVAAALAVLVVLAAGIISVRAFSDDQGTKPVTHPTKPTKPAIIRTDYPDGALVSDVWPKALRRIPSALAGVPGQVASGILRLLPAGRILVQTMSGQLMSVDPTTGDRRAISPTGQQIDAIGQAVNPGGEKWIVWAVRSSTTKGREIWRAPAQGGPAVKVWSLDPKYNAVGGGNITGIRLSVLDDTVLIDPETWVNWVADFGVLRLPLDGRTAPAVIPGSHDYRLLQWPWFGSSTTMNNATIWNAETSERRTTPLKWKSLSCSASWCVGLVDGAVEVARHDGSDVRKLVGKPALAGQRIAVDRFVINLWTAGGTKIYDLEAGKYLVLPGPTGSEQWNAAAVAGENSENPFLAWPVTAKGKPDALQLMELGEMH